MHDGDAWVCGRCDAENVAHGFHWCHQVCTACLTPHYEKGPSRELRPDGFFDAAGRKRAQENIAANGGRYVPSFS